MTIGGHVLYVHRFTLNRTLEKRIKRIEGRRSYEISNTANYDGFYAALAIVEGKLMLYFSASCFRILWSC